MTSVRTILHRRLRALAPMALVALGMSLAGCEVDSFFNPSVTGYWEHTPTTIPILERLDVIEQQDDYWGQASEVTPEDLIPSDLSYRTAPGDYITVQVYELFREGEWSTSTRRIDAGGLLRVPKIGEIQAAGRTPQELEDAIRKIVARDYIPNPQVDVVVEESGGFHYTLYGAVRTPSMYTLVDPDLRLLDALALAGGTGTTVKNIYVIRQVELSESVKPAFERNTTGGVQPPAGEEVTEPATPPTAPVDIDELIEQMEKETPPPAPAPPGVSPGVLRQDGEPQVDVDQLEPARAPGEPAIDIDALRTRREEERAGEGTWVYDEERGEWMRVPRGEEPPGGAAPETTGEPPLYVERILRIPHDRLRRGESKYNIVVRPNDRIYIEPPPEGVVYIDGQISRPGSFTLPPLGITLSRLVASAGGLGQLAIPERVDLIRMVGDNREAAIRLNLAAIRHRTEPDVLLKPNDHVIIGTNFIATPLAVIRNGFRATYGFGLLLDRNFGNDVFGVPPGFVAR